MGIMKLFQRLFGAGKNLLKTDAIDATKDVKKIEDPKQITGGFDETTKPGEFKKGPDIIDQEGNVEAKVYSYRPESFTDMQRREGRGAFSDDALREEYIDSGASDTKSLQEFINERRGISSADQMADEVAEAGELAKSMGKADPEELTEIRDMANKSKEMLDEMGFDTSNIDFDLVNNTDDMTLIHQEMLKLKKVTDSMQGGAGALPPDQFKKIVEAVQAEANVDVRRALQMAEDAMTPGEVDKAQKILLDVREALTESVRTGVYNSPFGRAKNAKGGRIKFQAGMTKAAKYLMKLFGGSKTADKIADVKQMENVSRNPKTDLTRRSDTDPKQPTFDEMEQMFMDDPRYNPKETDEMLVKIQKEKIRADVADRMEVDPEDVDDSLVEMLYQEGYDVGFKNGGQITGVGSLFKRRA